MALGASDLAVEIVVTPSASEWIDIDAVRAAIDSPPRDSHRKPEQSKRSALPDVAVVVPATFNTISKAALGIADTYAHSFLCECVAARVPTIFVPMINDRLWEHPALAGHIERLETVGAHFIDIRTGDPGSAAVQSGTGDSVVAAFDPGWLVAAISARLP
jgi:phosphopantothenoylcysteine synthetase/decarboxylase